VRILFAQVGGKLGGDIQPPPDATKPVTKFITRSQCRKDFEDRHAKPLRSKLIRIPREVRNGS